MSDQPVFEVKCPGCKLILIIDRRTGQVVEQRKQLVEESESSGDRFEDAMRRAKSSAARAESKAEQAREREKSKMERLDRLFSDSLKKKIEEGDTGRPESPLDLD